MEDVIQSQFIKASLNSIFSQKAHKLSHQSVLCNSIFVQRTLTYKHLGVYFDENTYTKKQY